MSKSPLYIILLLLCIFCSAIFSQDAARAASDGALDTTSTGDTFITLGVTNLVRITGVSDINLGTYSGSGDLSQADDVCVWTNQSGGNYKVLAQGDGASNAFTLTGQIGSPLPYAVRWNGTTGTASNTALVADTLSAAFSGASTTSSNCAGGSTANFQVILDGADLLAAKPGIYTGVLTFVISPSA